MDWQIWVALAGGLCAGCLVGLFIGKALGFNLGWNKGYRAASAFWRRKGAHERDSRWN